MKKKQREQQAQFKKYYIIVFNLLNTVDIARIRNIPIKRTQHLIIPVFFVPYFISITNIGTG